MAAKKHEYVDIAISTTGHEVNIGQGWRTRENSYVFDGVGSDAAILIVGSSLLEEWREFCALW